MAQDGTMFLRPKLLTNSAAEFVETQAGQAIITQCGGVDNTSETKSPVFVSEIDAFVPYNHGNMYEIWLPLTGVEF
jgi:hypothetical protein